MKLKALITTLVLGTSSLASVAVAHPVNAPAAPAAIDPIVRDHRAPARQPTYEPTYHQGQSYRAPFHRARWVTLGTVDQIADGEMTFRVGRSGDRFRALKLQSEGGKTRVFRVLIQFANGRTQVAEVNQYLNASNRAITIDLDGRARAISKVTVIGRNARQSGYRLMAI